jgi:hypothetical protein
MIIKFVSLMWLKGNIETNNKINIDIIRIFLSTVPTSPQSNLYYFYILKHKPFKMKIPDFKKQFKEITANL